MTSKGEYSLPAQDPHKILQASLDAIITANEQGRVIAFNPAAEVIFGYSAVEAHNRCLTELIIPERLKQKHTHSFERYIKTEEKRSIGKRIEVTAIRANGEELPVEMTLTSIKQNGQVVVTAFLRDLTEKKQAEIELLKLRNLLSSIINSMPSVLIGVDPKGVVTHWNREAEKIYGIDSSDAIGKRLPKLIVQLPDIEQIVEIAIREESQITTLNQEWQILDVTHYMDVIIYPLLAEGIVGAVVRLDDVTEKRRLEEVMVQSEKLLSLGGLVAGMAHEINNPLAGILQNTQVIQNRLSAVITKNREVAQSCDTSIEKIRDYMEKRDLSTMLDMILKSGQRASHIVNNMFSFSRKSDLNFTKQDIAKLLDETVDMASSDYSLRHDYDFRKIDIIREYAAGMPKVWCEGNQLRQVFLNLLKNGAQAMASAVEDDNTHYQHQFILRVYPEADNVVIELEDNGRAWMKRSGTEFLSPSLPPKGLELVPG